MAEVIGNDGTWTFDGEVLRIVPGNGRGVHRLRRLLGEISVPLDAVAGIAYEPGGRSGVLRVRLRQGADPLLQAAGGALTDKSDPYRLKVNVRRSAPAEYFVDEVRNWLELRETGAGPAGRHRLPGPDGPVRASGSEGWATFDGETVRLDWYWIADSAKAKAGPRTLRLREVASVELRRAVVIDDGYLRFRTKEQGEPPAPKRDANTLMMWGFKKEEAAVIALASAVVARLPHPSASGPAVEAPAVPEAATGEDHHDTVLRRLRELGDLHKRGVLTAEEFDTAKQALLRRL